MYLENQAPTGPFGDAAAENDLAILERWRRLAGELDDLAPHLWHRPAVGRCNEYSAISEQLPSLPLRWTADMAPCQLHGVLERIHPDRHLIMVNILAGEPKDGHFLRALLSIVTLSALGFDLPKTIKVMVNSGNEVLPPRRIRDYWVPPQDVAHQWLCTMTQDLFTGFHPYRLPIEVVMNWYRERQRTSDAGPVLRINQRTSDDFGPLDDLSPFSLPDIETADEYVARRFDLILRARHS